VSAILFVYYGVSIIPIFGELTSATSNCSALNLQHDSTEGNLDVQKEFSTVLENPLNRLSLG
jgi:hypothetical protein